MWILFAFTKGCAAQYFCNEISSFFGVVEFCNQKDNFCEEAIWYMLKKQYLLMQKDWRFVLLLKINFAYKWYLFLLFHLLCHVFFTFIRYTSTLKTVFDSWNSCPSKFMHRSFKRSLKTFFPLLIFTPFLKKKKVYSCHKLKKLGIFYNRITRKFDFEQRV